MLTDGSQALLKEMRSKALVKQCNLQRDLRKAKSRVCQLEEENTALRREIQDLLKANDNEAPQLNTRDKMHNRFTDAMRLTLIELQGKANVPSTQCAAAIKIVAKNLFNTELGKQDLPSTQTAINVGDEGGVLAQCQVAEKMLKSKNITLHSDGTSRGGHKLVSEQVNLDCGTSLTLGLAAVAREDATTLLDSL